MNSARSNQLDRFFLRLNIVQDKFGAYARRKTHQNNTEFYCFSEAIVPCPYHSLYPTFLCAYCSSMLTLPMYPVFLCAFASPSIPTFPPVPTVSMCPLFLKCPLFRCSHCSSVPTFPLCPLFLFATTMRAVRFSVYNYLPYCSLPTRYFVLYTDLSFLVVSVAVVSSFSQLFMSSAYLRFRHIVSASLLLRSFFTAFFNAVKKSLL